MQAINKKSADFFTKDDEGILCILSVLSYTIIRNAMSMHDRISNQNTLRDMVDVSQLLYSLPTEMDLIMEAERLLIERFDYCNALVYLVDE